MNRRLSRKEEPIGIALVGAGSVAHLHARAVADYPEARLIGWFDPDAERAATMAGQYGGRVYRRLSELLADPAVQAVHVLTPPSDHVAVSLAALAAGKHVLVEKPVADKAADLLRLKRAAARAKRICLPAHNYIHVPALARAKRLIETGKLGQIAALWILYNLFHSEELGRKYGSIFRVVMTHHAYSLLYLLGRPVRLNAMALPGVHYRKLRTEGQAAITCEMPGGVIANLWASFSAKDLTNDPWNVVYKVLGTQGGVSYSWSEAQYEKNASPGARSPGYVDGFRGELDHFITRCIRRGEAPLSSLDDALDALSIIEAAEWAVRKKQGFVPVRYHRR